MYLFGLCVEFVECCVDIFLRSSFHSDDFELGLGLPCAARPNMILHVAHLLVGCLFVIVTELNLPAAVSLWRFAYNDVIGLHHWYRLQIGFLSSIMKGEEVWLGYLAARLCM